MTDYILIKRFLIHSINNTLKNNLESDKVATKMLFKGFIDRNIMNRLVKCLRKVYKNTNKFISIRIFHDTSKEELSIRYFIMPTNEYFKENIWMHATIESKGIFTVL